MTTKRSRGISTSMFLRLCARAPRTTMLPAIGPPLAAELATGRGDRLLDDPLVLGELLRRLGLEAHHQDGLRVRGAHEAPAVREADADPVDVDDVAPLGTEAVAHAVGDRELAVVGAVDADLGRAARRREVGQELRDRATAATEDLEEPGAGVDAVVVPEVALLEEHVTAHLATQERPGLAHLGLQERVARLPHDAPAAVRGNVVVQSLRALDLRDDDGVRVARKHVARIDDEKLVAPDDAAARVHRPDPIGVAVAREPELGPRPARPATQAPQGLRHLSA